MLFFFFFMLKIHVETKSTKTYQVVYKKKGESPAAFVAKRPWSVHPVVYQSEICKKNIIKLLYLLTVMFFSHAKFDEYA